MILLKTTIDAEALDQRVARLPAKVRQQVCKASIRRVLRKGVGMAQASYPRSGLQHVHLVDSFLVRVKDYKFAVWGALGVRVGAGKTMPGWRFHFTEGDRRSRAGVGRGSRSRLRQRSDGGIREGGVAAGRVIPGRKAMPRIHAALSPQIVPEMKRQLDRVVAR